MPAFKTPKLCSVNAKNGVKTIKLWFNEMMVSAKDIKVSDVYTLVVRFYSYLRKHFYREIIRSKSGSIFLITYN